jgi:hypothetical protein
MLFTQSFEKGFVYCKKTQNNVQSLICEVTVPMNIGIAQLGLRTTRTTWLIQKNKCEYDSKETINN